MYVYSSFLMWKNNRNAFCKTRAARNSCSKGNIDCSKSAVTVMNASYLYLAAQQIASIFA